MSKKDLKLSAKLLLYFSVAIIACMAIYGMFESIKITMFTNVVGINIYSEDQDGNIIQERYFYKDGETSEDIELEDGEKFGEDINSTPSKTVTVVFGILEQLLLLFVFYISFDVCLREYFRKQKYNHELNNGAFDKFKGLKIGLVSAFPSFIIYILLCCGKIFQNDNLIIIFKSLNWHIAPLIRLFNAGVSSASGDISWFSVILCSFSVLLIPFCAQVAFVLANGDGKYYQNLVYKEK